MVNLTKRLKNIESTIFDHGGCAIIRRAVLNSEDSTESYVVAIKFPNLQDIGTKSDAESDEKRKAILRRWNREKAAGQSLSHPNILAFLGFCDNPDPRYKEFIGIVLPFFTNGNASVYLQRYPSADKHRILVLVAAALHALHGHSLPIIHGDIKAANILINDRSEPLLADFGLSRVCGKEGYTTKSFMGSLRWMAVELLRPWTGSQDELIVRTTQASDVWALGMTILELLTGMVPFVNLFDPGVFGRVVFGGSRPKRPHESLVSNTMWTLLEHCWAEDPSERPDARHVGLVLDVMYGFGQDKVESRIVADVLTGTLDNVSIPPQGPAHPVDLPYPCKWLYCGHTFDNIDDCIAHECAEFDRRCAAASV